MAARRQQLMDAAVRVFAERGFRGATTREIAVAAGVTEAVIFQHFPDKTALYAAILEQKAEELETDRWFELMRAKWAVGDEGGVIRTLFEGILDRHERDPHFMRLMVYSALEHHPLARRLHAEGARLYELLERFIREGQDRGRFREGSIPVLVRAVLALPVYYVFQRRLFVTPWPAASRSDLLDAGVQFALAGLAAPDVQKEAVS